MAPANSQRLCRRPSEQVSDQDELTDPPVRDAVMIQVHPVSGP